MRKSGYLAVSYDQRALFEGCVSRTRHDNPLMVRSAEHLALAFLYETAYSAGKTTAAKPNPLIEASLALMQKEMSRQITLPEIAAKVGLSEGYFSRFFKRATGTTPMVYLTRIRIDSAAYLLTSSALTVRAIAQQVGFRDEFHFSRVFKKLKGWSPSRFREVHDDIASQR